MHSKNIDKCGKNPQSARRKPNYHTKCGKNSRKILSVWTGMNFFLTDLTTCGRAEDPSMYEMVFFYKILGKREPRKFRVKYIKNLLS